MPTNPSASDEKQSTTIQVNNFIRFSLNFPHRSEAFFHRGIDLFKSNFKTASNKSDVLSLLYSQ
jgi:hypothetical protein